MDTDGQFGRPLTNFKGTIRQTTVLRCALPRPFAMRQATQDPQAQLDEFEDCAPADPEEALENYNSQ